MIKVLHVALAIIFAVLRVL